MHMNDPLHFGHHPSAIPNEAAIKSLVMALLVTLKSPTDVVCLLDQSLEWEILGQAKSLL